MDPHGAPNAEVIVRVTGKARPNLLFCSMYLSSENTSGEKFLTFIKIICSMDSCAEYIWKMGKFFTFLSS